MVLVENLIAEFVLPYEPASVMLHRRRHFGIEESLRYQISTRSTC